jgi:hypothetical protein
MDFRTDPQFERYDSSGWSYNAQEQTLLLKMRHRATVEHVRIFYRAGENGGTADPAGAGTNAANNAGSAGSPGGEGGAGGANEN